MPVEPVLEYPLQFHAVVAPVLGREESRVFSQLGLANHLGDVRPHSRAKGQEADVAVLAPERSHCVWLASARRRLSRLDAQIHLAGVGERGPASDLVRVAGHGLQDG